MSFLTLNNISKSYPSPRGVLHVLRDIQLSIQQGEFVSVVGYSGSGKTTLISLIAGLIHPDTGTITLEGQPVETPGPDRGVIFQNYSLLPWLTVYENVHLAVEAVNPKATPQEKKEKTEHFVRLVKLEAAMQKKPRELSGGMRQRVSVARGLAMDPKILLLDEPFSALDALTRSTLQEELSRIWEESRKTVIMITNDVDEAILLADRIFPLTKGPGATLGPEISVTIPRPRKHRRLSLEPGYKSARKAIVDFLLENRGGAAKTNKVAELVPQPLNGNHMSSVLVNERLS